MNKDRKLIHPAGAVQGVCSAAIGLLALLIAFIGFTGFNAKSTQSPWQWGDLWHLVLSLLAVGLLASVPWLATQPQPKEEDGRSIERARRVFAWGAACVVAAITIFVIRDFSGNHV